jgi:WD40 repeat protein
MQTTLPNSHSPLATRHSPLTLGPHQAPVYALAEGSTQTYVFTGGGDRVVALWDILTGEQQPFVVRTDAPIYALLYHLGILFIGCSNGVLHAVNIQSKQETHAWSLDTKGIFDLKMDVARNRLLVGGGNGILTVIDFSRLEVMRSIPLSDGKLRRLALDTQGDFLAVADNSGPVHVLDAESYQTNETINSHDDGATSVVWHPSKPVLITGGKDAFIRCHSITDGFKQVLAFAAHQSAIYDIVFHPGANCFVSCSRDKSIKWWNPLTFDPMRKLSFAEGGHKHSVNRLLVMGPHIISVSDDRGVLVFGA